VSDLTFVVTDANFQDTVLKSSVPVLVDFWAEWCPPCKMIAPIVDEIAQKYGGKLLVGKLDTDHNSTVPTLFDIQGIPTLILFKEGQAVEEIVGFRTRDQLEKVVASHLQTESVE